MKKVFVCDDLILAGHLQSLLQGNDIECHLRNMSLTGGIGELPINECWPEVWVNDDRDEQLARTIIDSALENAEPGQDWRCRCGEHIEGQFERCWACGAERPAEATTSTD